MDKVTFALVKARAANKASAENNRLSNFLSESGESTVEQEREKEKKRLQKLQQKRAKEREKIRKKYREKYNLDQSKDKRIPAPSQKDRYGDLRKYGSEVVARKEQESRCSTM